MHPTTLELKNSIKYLKELFLALDNFKDYSIVFTSSNSDISGTGMTNLIKKYTSNNNNSYFFSNLGQLNYLSVLNEKFISKIVRNLEGLGESEIPTPTIGKFIMEGLSSLDKVAMFVLLQFIRILKKQKILNSLWAI